MSFSYLDDKSFVDFVLEKGSIPFVVRGTVSCFADFNFAPIVGVKISGPTYHIRVFGENPQKSDDHININVRELVEEVVFSDEIELPEHSIEGISKALSGLEQWADFFCLAAGNPKVMVEIQRPVNAVVASYGEFDSLTLRRWQRLVSQYSQLAKEERKKLASALWWYRKGSSAAYYSLFDSYTAYWNCLEILCDVSGSKSKQGETTDKQIEFYLKNKKKITSGHILRCYNNFVNYSIKEQMKDALRMILGTEQALQVIYQCFEIKPDRERLYQIRNDINHGNIRENSGQDYVRVHFRGMLLWEIVFSLINQKMGHHISSGMSINESADKLESFRREGGDPDKDREI
jgi:hypothetical protein